MARSVAVVAALLALGSVRAIAQLASGESFSVQELDSLAQKVIQMKEECESFESFMKQSWRTPQIPKHYISDEFEFHIPMKNFGTLNFDKNNYWRDNFSIIACFRVFQHPWYARVLAMGRDGSVFLLFNFDRDDWKRLIQSKIGSVTDVVQALRVAKLYVAATMATGGTDVVVVDSANIDHYRSIVSGIREPVITKQGRTYHVTMYTVDGLQKSIILWRGTIAGDGTVSFKPTTVFTAP